MIYITHIPKIDKTLIPGNSYLKKLPFIRFSRKLVFDNPVTFFVGENGSGKSTLLEAIAVNYGFNPEGGSKNFNFTTRQTHSDLHKFIKVIKSFPSAKDGFFLRAESFYTVSTEIEELREADKSTDFFENYGGKSLHYQSHGEAFRSLVFNRFWGNGLYILDEPEAALSPISQLALLRTMKQLVENNSQFIIATHSPIIMAYPKARIFEFHKRGIRTVEYADTDHYCVTKAFLNNPDKMLQNIFKDED